jgi:hypothetical protein
MADEIHIALFLEDAAQESFLSALMLRIAEACGVEIGRVVLDVRSAAGGKATALSEYARYIRDVVAGRESAPIVVVAVDSDCKGRAPVVDTIRGIAERVGYQGSIIGAVPVPHIEKWYCEDRKAFALGTGAPMPALPFKCEPDYYKRAVLASLKQSGVVAPLAAAPYGADIARVVNLELLRTNDSSFDGFYTDVREVLARLA